MATTDSFSRRIPQAAKNTHRKQNPQFQIFKREKKISKKSKLLLEGAANFTQT
jgi:hypothetical protein